MYYSLKCHQVNGRSYIEMKNNNERAITYFILLPRNGTTDKSINKMYSRHNNQNQSKHLYYRNNRQKQSKRLCRRHSQNIYTVNTTDKNTQNFYTINTTDKNIQNMSKCDQLIFVFVFQ